LAVSLSPLQAHDLWLKPEPVSSEPKAILIRAVVGSSFPRDEETKKAADYENVRFQQKGTLEPLPDFGKDPKLLGRVPGGEGCFVSAVGPTREVDLTAEEARGYLREEVGLDEAAMAPLLENAGQKLHETYSRTLKSLVIPAAASTVPPDVPFGLPLEIQLLRYERAEDGRKSFAFRLFKDSKPLAGAAVRVVGSDGKTLKARTDERGEAEASIVQGGPILIAFIELTGSGPGRYETRWTNLAIYDLR
ncbi:MAG: DUF4198 domain-containing protein, partial [Acidobacteria bacterium]|nr:DUF4198 domain-containing protein [Acidobacteriota bacterium]